MVDYLADQDIHSIIRNIEGGIGECSYDVSSFDVEECQFILDAIVSVNHGDKYLPIVKYIIGQFPFITLSYRELIEHRLIKIFKYVMNFYPSSYSGDRDRPFFKYYMEYINMAIKAMRPYRGVKYNSKCYHIIKLIIKKYIYVSTCDPFNHRDYIKLEEFHVGHISLNIKVLTYIHTKLKHYARKSIRYGYFACIPLDILNEIILLIWR